MVWVVGIIVVVIILSVISGAANKTEETQKKAEFNQLAQSRADAYVAYLRRTSDSPEFNRMTDLEIRDMVLQKVRSYKSESATASGIAQFLFFAGVVIAVILGVSSESWVVFFVVGGLSLLGAGSVASMMQKNVDSKFRVAGFDPGKLKIEE